MSIPCQHPNIFIVHRQGIFHTSYDGCPPYIDYRNNYYYYYNAGSFTDEKYSQFYTILNNMQGKRYFENIDFGWFELNSQSIPIPITDPSIVEFLQSFNGRRLLGPNSPPPLYIQSGAIIFEINTIYENQ